MMSQVQGLPGPAHAHSAAFLSMLPSHKGWGTELHSPKKPRYMRCLGNSVCLKKDHLGR